MTVHDSGQLRVLLRGTWPLVTPKNITLSWGTRHCGLSPALAGLYTFIFFAIAGSPRVDVGIRRFGLADASPAATHASRANQPHVYYVRSACI